MEIALLVLEFLKVLLWPGIVVAVLFLFKDQLRNLLANIGTAVHRIKRLTAPGTAIELSVADQVAELKQEIEEQEQSPPVPSSADDQASGSLDDLTRGRIMRIWSEIEMEVQSLFKATFQTPGIKPLMTAVMDLSREGLIPLERALGIRKALSVRSRIQHSPEGIPLGTVDDYISTITQIRQLLKKDRTQATGQSA